MKFKFLTAALGLSVIVAAPAAAAPVIDGVIDVGTEGWNEVVALQNSGNGAVKNFYVASDATNLYLAARTSDDDAGKDRSVDGFDIFNVNFGLDGNTAPWRYRIRAENGSFEGGTSDPIPGQGDWQGLLDGGDDSVTSGGFGEPGGLSKISAAFQAAIDLNGGHREHEFAIPWASLLDGNNGWDIGTTLALRIGGFYAEDGSTFTGYGTQSPNGGIDFGDQSTYALVDVAAPVPVPAALPLFLAGAGALGIGRRTRKGRG